MNVLTCKKIICYHKSRLSSNFLTTKILLNWKYELLLVWDYTYIKDMTLHLKFRMDAFCQFQVYYSLFDVQFNILLVSVNNTL